MRRRPPCKILASAALRTDYCHRLLRYPLIYYPHPKMGGSIEGGTLEFHDSGTLLLQAHRWRLVEKNDLLEIEVDVTWDWF